MFGVEYYTQYVMYYEFYGILRESQPDSFHPHFFHRQQNTPNINENNLH